MFHTNNDLRKRQHAAKHYMYCGVIQWQRNVVSTWTMNLFVFLNVLIGGVGSGVWGVVSVVADQGSELCFFCFLGCGGGNGQCEA